MRRRLAFASITLLVVALAFAVTVLRAANLVTFTIVGQYGPLGSVGSDQIGIDWLPSLPNQDQLLVSRNWQSGVPDVFGRITATTGAASPWGTLPGGQVVSGWEDEIYFSSVRPGQGPNWRVGDVFSAQTETSDPNDPFANRTWIARFRADGTMVKQDFAVLPSSETKLKRGAVRFDYAGVVNHDLIVVAADDIQGPSTVYTIQSTGPNDADVGVVTKLVDIPMHLEGLTTIPNDPAYGPLAGKIVAGTEFVQPNGLVAIDPANPAAYTFLPLMNSDGVNFRVEDLWVVPPDSTFYGVDFPDRNPQATIWKVDAGQWTSNGFVGKLLLAQEYDAQLYILDWNGSAFTLTRIYDGPSSSTGLGPAHWEHITFVPVSHPNITIKKYTNTRDADDPNGNDVPNVDPGSTITWTYVVTNTGNVPVAKADVQVTDNTTGVTPTFDHEQTGNGDAILDPGEVWIYTATGTALDLTLPPPAGVNTVANSCTANGTQPPRTAYTNVGRVTIPGAFATDPSSYCNPPSSGKSITIGPSSMEGAIRIDAGDWVNGGYSFKTNFTGNITIAATVSISGKCIGGTLPSDTLTVNLGSVAYAAVAGSDWKPTGDANSILSWQGSIVAPPTLCGGLGGQLDGSKGAVFNATITGAPAGGLVTFRFKFRDPAAKGKPNTNCLNAADPNRNRADVCGASWSGTKIDP